MDAAVAFVGLEKVGRVPVTTGNAFPRRFNEPLIFESMIEKLLTKSGTCDEELLVDGQKILRLSSVGRDLEREINVTSLAVRTCRVRGQRVAAAWKSRSVVRCLAESHRCLGYQESCYGETELRGKPEASIF